MCSGVLQLSVALTKWPFPCHSHLITTHLLYINYNKLLWDFSSCSVLLYCVPVLVVLFLPAVWYTSPHPSEVVVLLSFFVFIYDKCRLVRDSCYPPPMVSVDCAVPHIDSIKVFSILLFILLLV